MKKFTWIMVALLAATVLVTGCSDDDDDATLTVEYTQQDVPVEGKTVSFDIKSNANWTISVPADKTWAKPSVTSGSGDMTVNVVIGENEGEAPREVTLEVKAGKITRTVKINQLGTASPGVTLTVEYTAEDVPAEGKTVSFDIKSNSDWNITVPEDKKAWTTPSVTSGNGDKTVEVVIGANPSESPRDVTLEVKAGTITRTVKIEQLGAGSSGVNVLYGFDISDFDNLEDLETVFATFTNLDKDGDGHAWYAAQLQSDGQPTGELTVTSASYYGDDELTPENYLIMPSRTLGTNGKINVTLQAQDPNYPAEKFKIVISDSPITLDNCRNAEVLHTHTLASGSPYSQELDIPASYNGKTIYAGVCHFDCTDEFRLNLVKFEISHEGPAGSYVGSAVSANPTVKSLYAPMFRK